MLTRRQFIRGVVGGVTTSTAAFAYMGQIEPYRLEVCHVSVPLNRAQPPRTSLRVLQLSDFHLSSCVSLEFIARSVELGLAEKPDLIALTGDFCTGKVQQASRYAAVLRRLSASAPTFACLGNHDGGRCSPYYGSEPTIDAALDLLKSANVTCLLNDGRGLTVRGQAYQIVGVGDLWSAMCDPEKAFAALPARGDAVRLVLNHNPDAKELFRAEDWDVMLCGHTHGGQIRLPLFPGHFAPVSDKRYLAGLYRWADRWMYITRGVGNLYGVRFNCRPEVTVLTLA